MSKHLPVIELESYRITDVEFKVYDSMEEIKEKKLSHGDLNASVGINDDYTYSLLRLKTVVIDEENLRTISVEVTGEFRINEENKEDVPGHLKANGTAILLPYLRAFISVLTSLDNRDAIIIPTVNTNNFSDVEREE